ncbi:uncharacterized protein LOC124645451 [Helicoverpa zea]|uniref:uncharacterized protein LOC124645451 n=1 Tax=Helicoverpa zea TaxID=7113 RepID=UPI001F5A2548|nr:uncharacterized protein LOC124645451 [Helicoverpa zea]
MELLKQTIYFLLFIFFCFHFVQAVPRISSHKEVLDIVSFVRPRVLLPAMPKPKQTSASPEATTPKRRTKRITKNFIPRQRRTTLSRQIQIILSQLQKGKVLRQSENYHVLLHKLKNDFMAARKQGHRTE